MKITFLCLVLAIIAPVTKSHANECTDSKMLRTQNSTVFYATENSNEAVFTEDRITTSNGKSLRLLPGTKIKQGEHFIIDISRKSHQDLIAERLSKELEKAMLATVAKYREFILLPEDLEETPAILKQENAPTKAVLGQQQFQLNASLTSTNYSFSVASFKLHKNNSSNIIFKQQVLAFQTQYSPLSSWGNCAETIKVMRC